MTDITEYRCENCGSSHLKEENDFIICQACGSKFRDNSKKVETPPVVKVKPQKENPNINTNSQNKEDYLCCCKGIVYVFLAFIIYSFTYRAMGVGPSLILGIIITAIIAYAVHHLTNKN